MIFTGKLDGGGGRQSIIPSFIGWAPGTVGAVDVTAATEALNPLPAKYWKGLDYF
jgi:hypothetical protein